MDNFLSADQSPYNEFRTDVKTFINEHIKPHSREWEKQRDFPSDLLKTMAERKYLGLSLPQQVGGQGKDFWHEVILTEELAKSETLGWALSIMVHTNMVAPLLYQLGSQEQHVQILKPGLQGQHYFALAATEESAGSDLLTTQTTLTYQPDTGAYLLNGSKKYITNGSVAKHIVTLVSTGETKDAWSLGLVVVPADTKGVMQKRLKTSGFKTGDTAQITFNNCVVGSHHILGKTGHGFFYLLKGLQRERLIGAVAMNALADYVLQKTIEHVKQKKRFNEALADKQVIRHRIAELSARIESSRQFCYSVCALFIQNAPIEKQVTMLKIISFETCQTVIRECTQLYGAEAFEEDHWLNAIHRDSQAFTLAAGSSEIMREVLAAMILS